MTLVQSLVSKLRVHLLGHLSPAEELALQAARRAVREGWISRKLDATDHGRAPFKLFGLSEVMIANLDAIDPAKQREAIADGRLQAYMAIEEQRNAAFKSMFYFQEKCRPLHDLSFSKAFAAAQDDFDKFIGKEEWLKDTEGARRWRSGTFPNVPDDSIRRSLARFCINFSVVLQRLMLSAYVDGEMNDSKFREDLTRWLITYDVIMLPSEEEFESALNGYERCVDCTEPRGIAHYLDVFRQPGWKERFFEAKRDRQSRMEAFAEERKRAEQAEKERAAEEEARVAKDKRVRLSKQLSFNIDGDCLDLSVHGWPQIEADDDVIALFPAMKSAFAQARSLRCAGMKMDGEDFQAIRTIASMTTKQLACVKMHFWKDRVGQLQRHVTTDHMAGLLNCDGKAQLRMTHGAHQALTARFCMIMEGTGADLERDWSDNLDVLQKWLESETLPGELARWFIEDRTDSTGWATSR